MHETDHLGHLSHAVHHGCKTKSELFNHCASCAGELVRGVLEDQPSGFRQLGYGYPRNVEAFSLDQALGPARKIMGYQSDQSIA